MPERSAARTSRAAAWCVPTIAPTYRSASATKAGPRAESRRPPARRLPGEPREREGRHAHRPDDLARPRARARSTARSTRCPRRAPSQSAAPCARARAPERNGCTEQQPEPRVDDEQAVAVAPPSVEGEPPAHPVRVHPVEHGMREQPREGEREQRAEGRARRRQRRRRGPLGASGRRGASGGSDASGRCALPRARTSRPTRARGPRPQRAARRARARRA